MAGPEVTDVMTDGVIGVEKNASVRKAAEKMRDEEIRGLVVLEDEEVVGILAGKDILYKVVAEDTNPSEIKVHEVMTEQVITAFETDDINDVAVKMIKNDISRVPIMNTSGDIVGMVTQTNLLHTWPGYIDFLEEKASAGYSNL